MGDYRIVREIGHGGMGVVYEAEQISLGRRVALKVLPWQVARDRTSLERFRREARASARLHHTNIVPVFEVGEDGEVRYYAMQFIQGQSLDAVIDELRRLRSRSRRSETASGSLTIWVKTYGAQPGGDEPAAPSAVTQALLSGRFGSSPDVGRSAVSSGSSAQFGAVPSPAPDTSAVMPGGAQLSAVESSRAAFYRAVAHIGRQAASALAHAHARGVVHRDIKPSNLLLDTEGVVWVTDFGLAKVDDDVLTRTGDILGTIRYMAPERFRGQEDPRADLFSLGLTLYELLLLRPAFDSPDRVALSEQIKTLDPHRPRSIDPRIPHDLETIVLKAIEKNPDDRYASAEALALDLRRFLDDEPILARRVGAPERYLRWARRNPVVAFLATVLVSVLVVVAIAATTIAGRMAALAAVNDRAAKSELGAKLAAQAALDQAELQRERAEQHLYIARIGQAEGALRLSDAATARALLDKCRPEDDGTDRRGWEWFYLDRWCRPELRTISLPAPDNTQAVAVSRDGRILAVGSASPFLQQGRREFSASTYLINLPEGTIRHELVGHKLFILALTFRADGKRLATLGDEGTVRIWDTQSGREVRVDRLGQVNDAGGGTALEPGRPAARERRRGWPGPDLGSRNRIRDRPDYPPRSIGGVEPGRVADRVGRRIGAGSSHLARPGRAAARALTRADQRGPRAGLAS